MVMKDVLNIVIFYHAKYESCSSVYDNLQSIKLVMRADS